MRSQLLLSLFFCCNMGATPLLWVVGGYWDGDIQSETGIHHQIEQAIPASVLTVAEVGQGARASFTSLGVRSTVVGINGNYGWIEAGSTDLITVPMDSYLILPIALEGTLSVNNPGPDGWSYATLYFSVEVTPTGAAPDPAVREPKGWELGFSRYLEMVGGSLWYDDDEYGELELGIVRTNQVVGPGARITAELMIPLLAGDNQLTRRMSAESTCAVVSVTNCWATSDFLHTMHFGPGRLTDLDGVALAMSNLTSAAGIDYGSGSAGYSAQAPEIGSAVFVLTGFLLMLIKIGRR